MHAVAVLGPHALILISNIQPLHFQSADLEVPQTWMAVHKLQRFKPKHHGVIL